mmetsp:Transcript_9221/g.27210  ORF Transcript_9221/g.27210 Transcript_9221/m.27210 type:complete len:222 (+) Transcript_9221:133-798(+)
MATVDGSGSPRPAEASTTARRLAQHGRLMAAPERSRTRVPLQSAHRAAGEPFHRGNHDAGQQLYPPRDSVRQLFVVCCLWSLLRPRRGGNGARDHARSRSSEELLQSGRIRGSDSTAPRLLSLGHQVQGGGAGLGSRQTRHAARAPVHRRLRHAGRCVGAIQFALPRSRGHPLRRPRLEHLEFTPGRICRDPRLRSDARPATRLAHAHAGTHAVAPAGPRG